MVMLNIEFNLKYFIFHFSSRILPSVVHYNLQPSKYYIELKMYNVCWITANLRVAFESRQEFDHFFVHD